MERLTYRLKTGEVLMATEYEEKYTRMSGLSCSNAALPPTRTRD